MLDEMALTALTDVSKALARALHAFQGILRPLACEVTLCSSLQA